MHVSEISASLRSSFGLFDYIIFLSMLLGCSGVGVYYAIKDRKKLKTKEEFEEDYLVGGRRLKIFPVAMSLIATWVSGISILGNATEYYMYGTEFCLICVSIILSGIIVTKLFLPVFVELQLTSLYEVFNFKINITQKLLYLFF